MTIISEARREKWYRLLEETDMIKGLSNDSNQPAARLWRCHTQPESSPTATKWENQGKGQEL